MFIPTSWGQLTGWKAVLAVIPIMAIIYFQTMRSQPHYHELAPIPMEIPAGQSYVLPFGSATQAGKIKVAVSDFSGEEYQLTILTKKNLETLKAIFASGTGDPESVPVRVKRTAKKNTTIKDLTLPPGDYFILIDNMGDGPMKCNLLLSEYR